MVLLPAVLAATLSRAEVLERFKAPPITHLEGLVQVSGNCPAEIRREYQVPIASFASYVCKCLYAYLGERPARFASPGIYICLGEGDGADTNIVVSVRERNGGEFTRIYIPSPAYADTSRLRTEVAKAFFLAVKGERKDDTAAMGALRSVVPELRAGFEYGELSKWAAGEKTEGDDAQMMRLLRKVIRPGEASVDDILRFASRLYLYPPTYGNPFCGKFRCFNFKDSILYRNIDPRVRFVALAKMPKIVAFGGGKGDELLAAAESYSRLLLEIARNEKTDKELLDMLDEADVKLNIALEKARKGEIE